MSFVTCRHIKENGAYCDSPALRGQKYCHFHLSHRARRLRRAWALSENRRNLLQIPPLEDLYAIRVVLSEIVQGLTVGQIDHPTAGKMLYAIQQVTSVSRKIDELEQTQPDNNATDSTRLQEYPEFEQDFCLPRGIDLEAETETAMRNADQLAAVLSIGPMPQPGSPVSAKPSYTREEGYQCLQWEVHRLRNELKEYHRWKAEQSKKEVEQMMKEAGYPTPPSVGGVGVSSHGAKQPVGGPQSSRLGGTSNSGKERMPQGVSGNLPRFAEVARTAAKPEPVGRAMTARHAVPRSTAKRDGVLGEVREVPESPGDDTVLTEDEPAAPQHEVTYEELRSAAQATLRQVQEREEKKKAASATPTPDQLTGSA